MGPTSFPILAEARMAERLLEAERARLARTAATGQGSARGRRERPKPQASPSSRGRLLFRASTLTLAGCLLLGGAVVGQADLQTGARPVVVPDHVLSRTATVARALRLIFGGTHGLPSSPCGVSTFGWVPGTDASLIDTTLLRALILLPVSPLR